MSELGFEQLLAQHHAELKKSYDDAEEFGADWIPPDNPKDAPYLVIGIKTQKGTYDKNGTTTFFWKPYVRLECPENPDLHGKDFPLGFFNTGAPGAMKGQAKAINGGEAVSFEELDNVFDATFAGKIMKVDVITATSKKNGQEYTNCYVREVVAVEETDTAQEEPPQGEKAKMSM